MFRHRQLFDVSWKALQGCLNINKKLYSTFPNVPFSFISTSAEKSDALSPKFSKLSLPAGFRITYCYSEEECKYLCDKLLLNLTLPVVVGCDAEWVPFSKNPREKIAVLQLCFSDEECYVFHLSQMGSLPKSLETIIFHRWIVKVGLGIKQDLYKLSAGHCLNVKPNPLSYIDIGKYAYDIGFHPNGKSSWSLKILSEVILKQTIDKNGLTKLSNWKQFPLLKNQLVYAATDAYVSWLLFKSLDMQRRLQEEPVSAYPYLAKKLK